MTITENTPTQLASAAVTNGTAAQLEEVDSIPTVLLNRKIENAPPDGPRNPVMRALCNTGRLLSSCFRSASNDEGSASDGEREAADARLRLNTLVLHLASGDAAATQLTTHCTQLGAAQREWQRVSPEASAQIEQSLRETVAALPAETQRKFLDALADPELIATLQRRGDGYGERAVLLLIEALSRGLHEGARARIGAAFDEVFMAARRGAQHDHISQLVDKVLESGWKTAKQLDAHGALPHLPDAGCAWSIGTIVATEPDMNGPLHVEVTEGPVPQQQSDHVSQCSAWLRSCILDSCDRCTAPPAEVSALFQRLSPESLWNLNAGLSEKTTPEDTIGTAVRSEIQRRLQHLAEKDGAILPQAESSLDGISKLADVEPASLALAPLGPMPTPERTVANAVQTEEKAERLTLNTPVNAQRKLELLQQRAEGCVRKLLQELESGSTAGVLAACKHAVAAARALRGARSATSGSSDQGPYQQLANSLVKCFQTWKSERIHKLGERLQTAEFRALIKAFWTAAKLADPQVLPELRADLEDAHSLLERLREHSSKPSSFSVPPLRWTSLRDIRPETSDALCRHFSTVIADGKVQLTAGRCGEEFTSIVAREIEGGLSDHAQTPMPDGASVPTQFYKDAERTNSHYRFEDGQELFSREDWASLTMDEQKLRIGDGFKRAVKFYAGEEALTRALLAMATQTAVACILSAVQEATDSPVKYGAKGRGLVCRQGFCGEDVLRFTLLPGADHPPRVHISYELHGGMYQWIDEDGRPNHAHVMPLDQERSHMKFSMTIEVSGDPPLVRLLGSPVYDVHLVRSPILARFPVPTREHLARPDASPLYRKLTQFAEQSGRQDSVTITHALELAHGANNALDPDRKFEHVRALCEKHLGADSVVARMAGASQLLEAYDAVNRSARAIFNEARNAAANILESEQKTGPFLVTSSAGYTSENQDAEARKNFLLNQGGKVSWLTDFTERVQALNEQKTFTVDDAHAFFVANLGGPEAADQHATPQYLPEDVIQRTHSRITEVFALRQQCFDCLPQLIKTLTPTVVDLMPGLTQQLRVAAEQAPTLVDIDMLD